IMRSYFLLFFLLMAGIGAFAQNAIEYSVSFPNAVHHEAEVEVEVPDVPAGVLTFRMSRSSPGRYATHEFGKNIYRVKAYDSKGNQLPVRDRKSTRLNS